MNNLTLALSAILFLAMIVVISPNILALNRGKILRNTALWLAIFTALALSYQNFGPGSKNPVFTFPGSMNRSSADSAADAPYANQHDDKTDDAQGYTPPKE